MGFNNIGSALIFGFRINLDSLHEFLHLEVHTQKWWEKTTFSKDDAPISMEAYTHYIRSPNLYGYDEDSEKWDERNMIARNGEVIAEVSCSKEDVLVHAGGEPYEYIPYLEFKRVDVGGWHNSFVSPVQMLEFASTVKQEDIDYARSFMKEKGIELKDEKPVWFLTAQDDY